MKRLIILLSLLFLSSCGTTPAVYYICINGTEGATVTQAPSALKTVDVTSRLDAQANMPNQGSTVTNPVQNNTK